MELIFVRTRCIYLSMTYLCQNPLGLGFVQQLELTKLTCAWCCRFVHTKRCPSVHMWRELCPLCIFSNTCWISYLYISSSNLSNCVACKVHCKIPKIDFFCIFFKFVTLPLSCFDLGSKMYQCSQSSCSSFTLFFGILLCFTKHHKSLLLGHGFIVNLCFWQW